MNSSSAATRIIWYEAVAFAAIIAMIWVMETSAVSTLLFGHEPGFNWRHPALETAFTFLVGMPAIFMSRRLVKQLHYLEGFLRVCAWCQKVGEGEDWISLEQYMKKTLDTETTHGICPTCLKKLQAEQHP